MEYYHQENKINFEKIPPTSVSIHKPIQQSFLKTYSRYNSCFPESPFLDPLHYGHALNEVSMPDFKTEIVPEDFPSPCSFQKCPRENACPCRKRKISSCEFCKCQSCSSCKNSENVAKSK